MTNIREINYVCEPSTISIKVEYIPERSGNRISFLVGDASAFSNVYRAPPSSNKADFNDFVKYCCNLFFNELSENEFISGIGGSSFLKGRYVYQNLKRVRAKSGYTIWIR